MNRDETQLHSDDDSRRKREAGLRTDTDGASYLQTQSQLDATPIPHVPESFGSSQPPPGYVIQREVGRGGMGVVYEAIDTRLKREVALKMLLAGRRDAQHLIRFLIEAEALAQVSHPHVVQVFEAGENGGHPFLAMEYLSGGTLAERMNHGRLPVGDAVRLMLRITRGMEAAHRLGIVHRDLKPSNIMFDAAGEPKVTDFGLAKKGEKDLTATESTMGTPAYMAPEQARGESKSAGPAADVYALGVMLYELTTGSRPFTGDTPATIVYQVIHDAPVIPRRHEASIPRDLEVITLKCLEKDPRARYADAGQLADDLQRFLEGEPISARPVGRLERGVKWARRNPGVAGSLAVAVVALLTGSVVSYVKYRDAAIQRGIAEQKQQEAEQQRTLAEQKQQEAEQQRLVAEERRKDAEQQTETARAVSEFLGGLFDDANPVSRTGRAFGAPAPGDQALTALQVVDRGAKQLQTSLRDKPRVRAALLDRIGMVYVDLGRTREAAPLIREALEIRRREFGPEHTEVAASLESLGLLQLGLGEVDASGASLEEALAIRRRLLGDNHPLLANTLFHLGTHRLIRGRYPESTACLRECLAIRQRLLEPESREISAVMLLMAFSLLSEGEMLPAGEMLQNAVKIFEKSEADQNLAGAITLFIQAEFASKLGNVARARELYEQSEAKGVLALGEDHYLVNACRGVIADFLRDRAKDDEASVRLLRKVVAGFRKSFGPDSPALASKLMLLARGERALKRTKAANEALAEARRINALYQPKK